MSKTEILLRSEIPDGAIWCIGQHTDAERRKLEAAARRGEMVKVRAWWRDGLCVKTVYIPVQRRHDDPLIKAARGARLMLYAWRGVRARNGLPKHPELDATITELEAALALRETEDDLARARTEAPTFHNRARQCVLEDHARNLRKRLGPSSP